MTYYVTSTEARSHARAELNIFDEITALMRKVIVASDNGDYEVSVDNGTLMTTSTVIVSVVGTFIEPIVTEGSTLIINNNTIVLGASGTGINGIVSDINDANIPGVIASKNGTNQLVIEYASNQNNWSMSIGDGTANSAVGLSPGTQQAVQPDSVNYYLVWSGATVDRKIDDEINRVQKYFTDLGYIITPTKNSSTGNTMVWNIYW